MSELAIVVILLAFFCFAAGIVHFTKKSRDHSNSSPTNEEERSRYVFHGDYLPVVHRVDSDFPRPARRPTRHFFEYPSVNVVGSSYAHYGRLRGYLPHYASWEVLRSYNRFVGDRFVRTPSWHPWFGIRDGAAQKIKQQILLSTLLQRNH